VSVGIFLACGKHLHDIIVSLREEVCEPKKYNTVGTVPNPIEKS
jgi:hypothetical protein